MRARWKALKEFLYGLTGHEFARHASEMRREMEAIFFVLTMGDYGTVATVGGGNITSVGTLIFSKIGAVQYPQGAASAVLLVIVLMVGVWVITRFSNLREER